MHAYRLIYHQKGLTFVPAKNDGTKQTQKKKQLQKNPFTFSSRCSITCFDLTTSSANEAKHRKQISISKKTNNY